MCSYLMLEIILFVSSRGGGGGGWRGLKFFKILWGGFLIKEGGLTNLELFGGQAK